MGLGFTGLSNRHHLVAIVSPLSLYRQCKLFRIYWQRQ